MKKVEILWAFKVDFFWYVVQSNSFGGSFESNKINLQKVMGNLVHSCTLSLTFKYKYEL